MHIILKGPFFVEFQTCQSPSKIFTKKMQQNKSNKNKGHKESCKISGKSYVSVSDQGFHDLRLNDTCTKKLILFYLNFKPTKYCLYLLAP